jgi:hypothetical protein
VPKAGEKKIKGLPSFAGVVDVSQKLSTLWRKMETEMITMKGKILDLRQDRDRLQARLRSQQARLVELERRSAHVLVTEKEFSQLRDRFRGRTIVRGKVQLGPRT